VKIFEEGRKKKNIFTKKMQHLRQSVMKSVKFNRTHTRIYQRFASTANEKEEKIEIPNYIQRTPTSILRALSQTVGFDHTAAHYKYHDDPYLIPLSNVGKRTFALAQESGRKSAKWIRQQHSQFFLVSSPTINRYMISY
jgi:pentatricopeptide repeat domain-containing protein 3